MPKKRPVNTLLEDELYDLQRLSVFKSKPEIIQELTRRASLCEDELITARNHALELKYELADRRQQLRLLAENG